MEQDAPAKWIYGAGIRRSRQRERPYILCKDQVEEVIDWCDHCGVSAQGAEEPERMCCGRPKFVNRVVMAN